MIPRRIPHGRGVMVTLVLATVVIQIVVAVMLKELADAHGGDSRLWLLFVLAIAVALNGLRFLVWGYTHKHYPLSHSYPLTAMFFPCILLVSAWYGDPIGWEKLGGVCVIVLGLVLMTWNGSGNA
ncbi:hypothetical protein MQC88_12135 [Luteimonas sp. 50]|uniref:EamA domain-containing protein n=1 Tax=Cognatiluteimonas sedimenti TaxID=2927791 RepID=A0ABT0A6V1_9GAMM|nr:hypothetical protein [Lysobacter sedimenti]MCJ0826692.1 hypothetical protein [Lysobacter sedimenti]